jgi:hypothetical protein
VPEPLHRVRAIHRRRLQLLAVDGLEAGQEQQHVKGNAFPDIDCDDARHRELRVGEPTQWLIDDPHSKKDRIEAAENRVENALPGECGDDFGNDPGQKDYTAQEVPEGQTAVEDQCDDETRD